MAELWAELGLPSTLAPWLLLAAAPIVLTACTAFTKISIVLAALRMGLGAERLLPLASIFALALVLTALVMAPVGEAMLELLTAAGGVEGLAGEPAPRWAELLAPLREFLARHADADQLQLFAELSGRGPDDALSLVPAFLVSELAAGLELALWILLPFVVVDLIAAEVLALLGLQHTPTAVIALPAKILLFLAADGWQTVIVNLVEGYR